MHVSGIISCLTFKQEGGHHQESYPMVQSMLEECDTSNEDATMFVISESGELKQRVIIITICDGIIIIFHHYR